VKTKDPACPFESEPSDREELQLWANISVLSEGGDLALTPERVTCPRDLLIDYGFERSVQPVDGPFTASGHR